MSRPLFPLYLVNCSTLKDESFAALFNIYRFDEIKDFIDQYQASPYLCIVIDLRTSLFSIIEIYRFLTKQQFLPPVIIYSDQSEEELIKSIQECVRRTEDNNSIDNIRARIDTLTTRELEILELISDGLVNKQISNHLGISQSTAEQHRANLMQKMKAKNAAQLIRFYVMYKLKSEER